ncbi:hypothetical protein Pfo_024392 [Paulownia fortunei]|nr:hypothetical protein Pfo_024392 [Paulownia fortunei]
MDVNISDSNMTKSELVLCKKYLRLSSSCNLFFHFPARGSTVLLQIISWLICHHSRVSFLSISILFSKRPRCKFFTVTDTSRGPKKAKFFYVRDKGWGFFPGLGNSPPIIFFSRCARNEFNEHCVATRMKKLDVATAKLCKKSASESDSKFAQLSQHLLPTENRERRWMVLLPGAVFGINHQEGIQSLWNTSKAFPGLGQDEEYAITMMVALSHQAVSSSEMAEHYASTEKKNTAEIAHIENMVIMAKDYEILSTRLLQKDDIMLLDPNVPDAKRGEI